MRSGRDVPLVDGEPLAGPAEAGHDLVGDVDDAVAVAEVADAGEVAVRRDEDAGRAGDRLEDEGRDRARALERDDLLEVLERALALLLDRCRTRTATGRRTARRSARPRSAPPSLAQRRGSPVIWIAVAGVAVVAAVGREHLVPAGVQARHAHGVLDRVGAAVGEEHLVEVGGRALDDQPGALGALVVRVLRRDGREPAGLLLDRRDDLRVLVADVDVDQLRGEVEVAVAVVVPDVAALGAGHDHRRDERLRGPGVEDVCAVELVDPGTGGRVGGRLRGGRSLMERRLVALRSRT